MRVLIDFGGNQPFLLLGAALFKILVGNQPVACAGGNNGAGAKQHRLEYSVFHSNHTSMVVERGIVGNFPGEGQFKGYFFLN